VIATQLADGPARRRVGLIGLERVPVRPGVAIVDAAGALLGSVTSGTLAPTANQPIAIAYLPSAHAATGTDVWAEVRGKRLPMRISPMPLTPHRSRR
jgi:aminomethyltransferase